MGYPTENCLETEQYIENVKCSLCLDILEDAIILPCSHKFCKKCIRKCNKFSEIKTCPNCQEIFRKNDVRTHQVRFQIKSIPKFSRQHKFESAKCCPNFKVKQDCSLTKVLMTLQLSESYNILNN